MSKNIYFLNEASDDYIDAVIIAQVSTRQQIEDAISKAKEVENYTWEDIVNSLPSDCEIHDRWSNEIIYY